MRADEFLTDTTLANAGLDESTSPMKDDDTIKQRIHTKERTLADIKRDYGSDNTLKNMGEILADIKRRHGLHTRKIHKDK